MDFRIAVEHERSAHSARFSHPTTLNKSTQKKHQNMKHAIGENLAYKECVVSMRTQNNGQTLKEY
jgi:hypothetical protein